MDVLSENSRPGSMDRPGAGLQEPCASELLIWSDCSISGYPGRTARRDEAAMDLVVQGSSGLLSITGTEQGGAGSLRVRRHGCDRRLVRDDRNSAGAAGQRAALGSLASSWTFPDARTA